MNPPDLPPLPPPAESVVNRDLPLVAVATSLTVAADFLLWMPRTGGTAVACFTLMVGVALALSIRERTPRLLAILALLSISAVQATIQLKPSTVSLLVILVISAVGEGHFRACRSMVGRLSEATLAAIFPWPAWRHLRVLFFSSATSSQTGRKGFSVSWRILQILLPAFLLGGVFSLFFASGNDVFRQAFASLFSAAFDWLLNLDFSLSRIFFWIAVFTLGLSLLQPARAGLGSWLDRQTSPYWLREDEALARWQSIAVLGLLNGLFCAVNTIDAVYLWSRAALPAGANPSRFLHSGVESLILAVLLSALVLVVLFQQRPFAQSHLLHWLASLWVLQNLVLIASVVLRLKLYIDDLQLTLLRVGVGMFLALVVVGFSLLTIYFWKGKSLGWLWRGNVLATFFLFFVVQFVDLDGVVADYNVDRWLRGSASYPDIAYLRQLGHGAWPALIRLATEGRGGVSGPLRDALESAQQDAGESIRSTSWRAWEWQRSRRNQEMVSFFAHDAVHL